MSAPPLLVSGRNCADCTLCCTVLAVKALNKAQNEDCAHAKLGAGCQIYAQRPAACAAFHCEFLLDAKLAAHWRPKRSRMVLYYDDEAKRLGVHVDPKKPDAWTQAPYHADLRRFARAAAPIGGQVIVRVGEERIAILPDRDKRLGALAADEVLAGIAYETPAGVIYDVLVVKKDDPRVADSR